MKQKPDQALLLNIGYKEKSGSYSHMMVAEKLTFQDICRRAKEVYRTQCDGKECTAAMPMQGMTSSKSYTICLSSAS